MEHSVQFKKLLKMKQFVENVNFVNGLIFILVLYRMR